MSPLHSILVGTIIIIHFFLTKFNSCPPATMNFQEYTLASFLGSGSFGVVWELVGREREKASALKVILVDEEDEEKQKRELEISPGLDHNNLVKVFTIERKGVRHDELDTLVPKRDEHCDAIIRQLRRNENFDVFCITLELCGETLRKWLKEEHDVASTMTTVTQFGIVKGIVEGLKYLHGKNIMHRDLKPENIMFSTKGYLLPVKIGDYGTCRILKDPQTSTLSSWVGTELYRAPETSSNDYGLYSDVYSLGLITWEVLQLLPFRTLRGHFDRLVNDKQKELVNLNPCFQGLTNLIVKMVERNVRSRHKNLNEINLGLCNLGTGKELVAVNSEELRFILDNCEDGWTIQLVEGVYEGWFKITERGVTLIGQSRDKTILRAPSTDFPFVLEVVGTEFKALNLKVVGVGSDWGGGIRIEADNCSLEGIIVPNIAHYWSGIDTKNSLNTKINNVHFENVGHPIFVTRGNCSVSDVTINNCYIGIDINNVDSSSIQSVSITNAKKCGIEIFASKTVRLQNVQIINDKAPTTARYPCGIRILGSPKGDIELRNVTCSGFGGAEEAGLFISKKSLSANVTVIDCGIGKIMKDAQRNFVYD